MLVNSKKVKAFDARLDLFCCMILFHKNYLKKKLKPENKASNNVVLPA